MRHYFLAAAIYLCGYLILAADFDVEETTIRAAITTSLAHWNAREMLEFSQAYTTSAMFINIFGETYIGRPAIADRKLKVHEDPAAQLIIDSIDVRQIETNSAVTTSRWRIKNSTTTISGIWTQIFIKHDGAWLIQYAHNQKIN